MKETADPVAVLARFCAFLERQLSAEHRADHAVRHSGDRDSVGGSQQHASAQKERIFCQARSRGRLEGIRPRIHARVQPDDQHQQPDTSYRSRRLAEENVIWN